MRKISLFQNASSMLTVDQEKYVIPIMTAPIVSKLIKYINHFVNTKPENKVLPILKQIF